MLKELKYLLYILVIVLFVFFTLKYYFSNEYIKKMYRNLDLIENKIEIDSKDLVLLRDNTDNVIQYIEDDNLNEKKIFNFWKLLNSNEK